jgi:PilZ domain
VFLGIQKTGRGRSGTQIAVETRISRSNKASQLELGNKHAVEQKAGIADARSKPRFKIEVEINIFTRTSGQFTGHTFDISESGISAIFKKEVPMGEIVELEFILPFGPVTVQATVRHRNAFRYGLQFVESQSQNAVIRGTCRSLAIEQSLEQAAGAS